jgi:UDP-N-acetylglucosamine--N-acetylmuramyl-(pentapeptide) pyrophosphoryl-undecaprenol N-acetylglucosamine transferase
MPEDLYQYPASKTITTGIPLQHDFVPVNTPLKNKYRQEIGVPLHARMLFIIGGGLGSQRINGAVADVVPHLLLEFPDLIIVHGVGRANEAEMHDRYAHDLPPDRMKRVRVYGYLHDVYRYSGAADIVVTRAGATNLAEFALQGKACIVVPSPFLTGGHQLKNAQYLADIKAAIVIDETSLLADSNRLARQASDLFKNTEQRAALGAQLATFAKPHATRDIARLIVEQLG